MTKKSKKDLNIFVCKRCGTCCSGAGFVHIHKDECISIAKYLDIPLEEFFDTYTVADAVDGERFLIDGPGEDKPCVFLTRDANGLSGCRIQTAKPRQCQGFPFKWRRPNFEKWCKGMQDEG